MDKFGINEVTIISYSTCQFDNDYEGVFHKKILPTLSVVQSISGNYDIKVGDSKIYNTGEMGVFIAPAGEIQEIVHHNGSGNTMHAQWIFIDALINGKDRFDDAFSFPVVLDKQYNNRIYELIKTVTNGDYCAKMSAIYSILQILTEVGEPKQTRDTIKSRIAAFLNEHYKEDVGAQDIAKLLFCSVSQVFRYTKKYFGLSPANYINVVRLQNAERLIRTTNERIGEIGYSVGFKDIFYFNKLFKVHYGESPSAYRHRFL